MEGISSSTELLDIKEVDEKEELPAVTSFISEASQPPLNTSLVATFTTTTVTSILPYTPTSTFPQSPTTTISSSVSGSVRRHSSLHQSAAEKSEGKSPPGITIDYIPGSNPKEDHEGLLIVNKSVQKERKISSGGESDTTRNRKKDKKGSRKNSKTNQKNTSEDEYASVVYMSPSVLVEKVKDSKAETRESKKLKKRRKLERSSRIENSMESQNSSGGGANQAEASNGKDSSSVMLQVDKPALINVTSLPLAVSAPARFV